MLTIKETLKISDVDGRVGLQTFKSTRRHSEHAMLDRQQTDNATKLSNYSKLRNYEDNNCLSE